MKFKTLKFSNTLREANSFIINSRDKAISRVLLNDKVDIEKFKDEDLFIQKEIIYFLLEKYYQDDLLLLCDKHIEIIFNLIYSKRANSYINLPNDVIARKFYNYFEIVKEIDTISSYEVEFDQFVSLPNNHKIEKVDYIQGNSNYICRLSSKEITLPIIVRTRRFGDKMIVKGLNGSKKVKDIFIDSKISITKRDLWPIVLDSSGTILWIPGIKKSKFDKKVNESYDIILKYS